MSHMLATVNPEAADAIDNPPAPPDVGTWVVFKGRAGFSRMQRTEFPALVLGVDRMGSGGLTLMVVMEPEDMMMEDRVPFRSHNQPDFYWRYRRIAAEEGTGGIELMERIGKVEEYLDGEDLLLKRVDTIEQVLASDEIEILEKAIWGDHERAAPSIMDHLQMMQKTLDSQSKRITELAAAVLPDGPVRTSRTKKGK